MTANLFAALANVVRQGFWGPPEFLCDHEGEHIVFTPEDELQTDDNNITE